MENGKGWHEWFMAGSFIMDALTQLDRGGVKPEHIQIVKGYPGDNRCEASYPFIMYYYRER